MTAKEFFSSLLEKSTEAAVRSGAISPPPPLGLRYRSFEPPSPPLATRGGRAIKGAERGIQRRAIALQREGRFTATPLYSRNARDNWSCSGRTKNDSTVRGVVWMKASTGMPGTSLRPSSRAISVSDTLMRTV